jgi:VWFA-related protein
MKKSVGTLLVVALLLPFHLLTLAQTPSPQEPQDDDVVSVESREVKLDVVVKDKRGRPVKDLKEADFEVYEDGVRQQIQSFRFVTREPGPAAAPPGRKDDKGATTVAPAGPTTPGVIALVFDRLAPEARSLARKAGLAYAQEGMAGGDFTGVFGIDLSLRTLQSFTDNPELVKQAVEKATSASTATYTSGSARVRDMAERGVAGDAAALAQIEEELRKRDEIDSTREAAPLRIPEDAKVINTEGNTFEQTVAQVVDAIRERERELGMDSR